jgi:single-strand DNA-binding protein
MNYAILTGRLGQDPQVRSTASGKKVANFTLATDDGFGANKKTSWHKIVCFGEQCGPIETYLKKGSLVAIRGRIDYREYEKDGVTKYITEILADNCEFLVTKTEDKSHYTNTEITDDDIPF